MPEITDATRKIENDREVINPAENIEVDGFTYILETEKFNKIFDHYFINSGEQESSDLAIEKFWENYEAQGPYKNGTIFWRCKPELYTYDCFDKTKRYQLYARFSIG